MNPVDLEEVAGLLAGGGILGLMMFSMVAMIVPIIAYWKILGKVGYPPPLALVILLPFAGLILLYWLAFAEWPALKPKGAGGVPYPPPAPVLPQTTYAPPAPVAPQAPGGEGVGQRFCTGCGAALGGEQRFCASCGKPVGG